MGRATREHINKVYKDRGEDLPYPNEAVEGEVEEILEDKKKGKK